MKSKTHIKPLFAEISSGEYDVIRSEGRAVPTDYSHYFAALDVHTFVLSPEVAASAGSLANDPRASDLLLGKGAVRLPYQHIAIEYAIEGEILGAREATDKQRAVTGMHSISHAGIYARELDEGGLLIQPYWKYRHTPVAEVTPIAFVFNMPEEASVGLMAVELQHPKNPSLSVSVQAVPSPVWLKSAHMRQAIPLLLANRTTFEKAVCEAVEELPVAFFSALMLLNCKSGVSATTVSELKAPSTYGKRLRRKHSCPAYTVISITELECVSPTGLIAIRADRSAHYVRGHFKARKSGLYWWNSFVRGSGTPRKRVAYSIQG